MASTSNPPLLGPLAVVKGHPAPGYKYAVPERLVDYLLLTATNTSKLFFDAPFKPQVDAIMAVILGPTAPAPAAPAPSKAKSKDKEKEKEKESKEHKDDVLPPPHDYASNVRILKTFTDKYVE